MRVERLLARLSGGSVWRDPREHVTGGRPKLSMEELMGALGGLDDGPTRLAYVMWGLSGADIQACERAAMVEATKLKSVQTNSGPAGLLRAFCRVAIAEVAMPPICRSCKGVGYQGPRACKRCEGSGNQAMSLRAKAQIASVHYQCSKDSWQELAKKHEYEAIYRMVERWRSRAIGHVWYQLSSVWEEEDALDVAL